jgi:AcrR family transcriptional regulator
LKPSPEKRRRLDPAEAREAILKAAEELLVRDGPDGLRLTEIAARASVSHPNVLYHFGSVAQLQAQLAERVVARLASEVAAAFVVESGDSVPIGAVVQNVFRVFDDGGYGRLIAWLALSANDPTFEAFGTALEGVRATIAGHPGLRGDENAARRRRIAPTVQLVLAAALGYGLSRGMLDAGLSGESEHPSVERLLGELLAIPIPKAG